MQFIVKKYFFENCCNDWECSETFKNQLFGAPQAKNFWVILEFHKKPPLVCPRSATRGGFLNINTPDQANRLAVGRDGPTGGREPGARGPSHPPGRMCTLSHQGAVSRAARPAYG